MIHDLELCPHGISIAMTYTDSGENLDLRHYRESAIQAPLGTCLLTGIVSLRESHVVFSSWRFT